MRTRGPIGSLIILLIRLALAAVFALAAWEKLKPLEPLADPQAAAIDMREPPTQEFAQAIIKLKLLPPESQEYLAPYLAFVVPWIEAVVAVALVLGLWTRAAAFITAALYAYFTWIFINAINTGADFDCYCLGKLLAGWPPWLHAVLDAVACLLALVVLFMGGGAVAADRLFESPSGKPAAADD